MKLKTLFKRGMSVLLALAISVSLVPSAMAAEESQTSGLSFNNTAEEYAVTESAISIPDTVEVRVKIPAGQNRRQIIMNNYLKGDENSWGIEVNTDNTLRYWERVNGEEISCKFNSIGNPINICTGDWMLISLVRDKTNGNVLAYINGELKGTLSKGKQPFHEATLTNPLYFGVDLRKNDLNSNNDYYLNGEISEVRMWSVARSADEIADYANQTVTGGEEGLAHAWLFSEPDDLGPNTVFNDLVTTGGIAVKTEGFTQRTTEPGPAPVQLSGLRFDAKDKEYVQVQGTLDIPTTVETWIKLDPGTNARQIIMNNYVGSGNSWGIEVANNNTLRYWESVSGSSANVFFDDINICTGEWMLISVVRDPANKQIRAYINGALAGTKDASSLAATSAKLTKWLCFGSDYHSSPIYMNGEISEVRMWSDIRTAEEIEQYYSNAVTGTADGLTHLWNFSDAGNVYSDTVFADQVTGGPAVKAVGFPVDPNTKYTVTFQLAGGTVSEKIADQIITVGGKVTAPTQNPFKAGFTFTGWYKDSSCTTKWNFDTDTVKSDTTLYAGYQFTFVSANLGDLNGVSFSNATDQLCSAERLTDIPRTFEATIKLPTDLTGRGGVICGNYMNAGYYDYDLGYVNFEISDNGQPRLYWQQGRRGQNPETQSVVIPGVDLRKDEWVHVAFTFDETTDTVKCYINGALVSTVDNCTFNPVIPAQALKVGGDYRGSGSKTLDGSYNEQYFKGEIANISIWSSVRPDGEIAADVTSLKTGTVNTSGDGLLSAWSFQDAEAPIFYDLSENENNVADFVDWLDPNFAKGDYSLLALPDTQFLSEKYPTSYAALTQWIVEHENTYNIKAVMHLGDMVNSNYENQWNACKTAMDQLNNSKIAWMPMRGNHDNSDWFNRYFPYNQYASNRAWFGGSYEHDVLGQDKLDSNYWHVECGGREYLIFSLGYAPSQGAINWAEEIIKNNPDKNVILTAHAFMYWDGTHLDPVNDLDSPKAPSDGKSIWDQLGAKYPNIVLALGGHIGYPDLAARTDKNGAGKDVTSILCDAQGIDYTYNLAMMMLLTFHEDSNEVDVNWYSVCNNKLFRTRNQFTITVPHVGENANTYTVNLPTDAAGYTVAAADGSTSPVAENGSFSFTVNIGDGYQKGAGFAVKANGTPLKEVDGKYTISGITADQAVTVEGVEPVAVTPTTYTVTLPTNVEGCTVAAAEGSTSPVAANGSFSFTVTIAAGYRQGDNFVVKANDTTLTADNGKYTISNITANQTVTVEGVEAVVAAPTTYTITFNANGGEVSETSSVTDTNGRLASLPTPTHSGSYSFKGWYTEANGGDMVTTDTVFNTDTTIYAQWTYTGGTSSGSSGSSSSNTTSETIKNPDGSTTTTTTNKATGTVTEVTKNNDGSTTTVETKKDGTVTETNKAADGTTGTVVTNKNGDVTEVKSAVSTKAATEAAKTGEAVTLPVEIPTAKTTEDAPAVQVTVPKSAGSVKVEIPVENVTPGTVAVIVKADGTEELVKTSVLTEDGVVLKLDGNANVKVIDNAKDFSDTNGHWAEDAISFVTAREMFAGTSATTFTPNSQMTRAQLMTVLARFDGVDTNGGSVWYEKGMEWAKANGVSDGSNPNGSITREQLATMLWRYSGSPIVEGTLDRFNDAGKVSSYAVDAMRWAVETGLISGIGNNTLAPQGNATRAQLATILMRYCENVVE